MKRIQEKVKDIVEVRPYTSVADFLRDPAVTVSNYHFSDATADMIVKWLDAIGQVGSTGVAKAVAGYRGVGKSHFLAVVSAIALHPEIRSKITDPHVVAGAQRMPRRHYPVVNVRRGCREDLVLELTDAVCAAFDLAPSDLGSSLDQILDKAKSRAGDLPLIVLIDTAVERLARVDRNDGQTLAEIAAIAHQKGIFVGVALDDDIAGADGSNSAISATYAIDYLDQENLYKVVNARVFPKSSRMQATLAGIYAHFRETIAQFRWSEQRFTSLYPLHPATLEVAPFIRLYVHDFSLLGFASEAGEKILGRPADSLIGLEEMFDCTESELRKADDLRTAFAVYDELADKVVGSMPVTARHRAKLILKALLLLSLDGRGSTAGEVSAAMMIFDETDPLKPVSEIEATMRSFVAASPDAVFASSMNGESASYSIRLGSNKLAEKLEATIAELPKDTARRTFLSAVGTRFTEFSVDGIDDLNAPRSIECSIEWRGSMRPGRIVTTLPENHSAKDSTEWEVFVNLNGENHAELSAAIIEWRPDAVRPEETKTLLAHHVILTNSEIRSGYGDQLPAALHAHTAAVDAIVERTMLTDARIVIEGFDYNFSEEARSSSSLSEIMSIMLEPLFETRFSDHPYFAKLLTPEAVTQYVSAVLGSSADLTPEAEELASTFGVPLGIAVATANRTTSAVKEQLLESGLIKTVFANLPENTSDVLNLNAVAMQLGQAPVGLTSEAVQLVLSATVANGLVEFVTHSGNRVSGRSLDLKIDWKQIAGVARPRVSKVSSAKLLEWAKIMSGEDAIKSLDDAGDRAKVLEALVGISAHWEKSKPLSNLEFVPESEFNTEIWRHSNKASENYAVMISDVDEALVGSIELEACVERVADNFGSRPEIFAAVKESVAAIDGFSNGFSERDCIRNYLALSEITSNDEVENARKSVESCLTASILNPGEQASRELGYAWEKFVRTYSDHYVSVHNAAAQSIDLKDRYDDIVGNERWRYFTQVIKLADIRKSYWPKVREYRRRLEELNCGIDPKEILESSPCCVCSFRCSDLGELTNLPDLIRGEIEAAIAYFDRFVSERSDSLKAGLEKSIVQDDLGDEIYIVSELLECLKNGTGFSHLSDDHLDHLMLVVSRLKDEEVENVVAPIVPPESLSNNILQVG